MGGFVFLPQTELWKLGSDWERRKHWTAALFFASRSRGSGSRAEGAWRSPRALLISLSWTLVFARRGVVQLSEPGGEVRIQWAAERDSEVGHTGGRGKEKSKQGKKIKPTSLKRRYTENMDCSPQTEELTQDCAERKVGYIHRSFGCVRNREGTLNYF